MTEQERRVRKEAEKAIKVCQPDEMVAIYRLYPDLAGWVTVYDKGSKVFPGLNRIALFSMIIFTGCGPMPEDTGGPVDSGHVVSLDAGYTEDAGIEEPEGDAGPCQAWRDQWCEQGCIGTIGIEPGCGELGCCE